MTLPCETVWFKLSVLESASSHKSIMEPIRNVVVAGVSIHGIQTFCGLQLILNDRLSAVLALILSLPF